MNTVALAVGLPDAPVLTTRAARGTGMAFLELNCERRNAGFTQAVREDAFLIALQMKTCPDFDLYADGRLIRPNGFNADDVAIYDLRTNLAADQRDPFHAVDLYLPRLRPWVTTGTYRGTFKNCVIHLAPPFRIRSPRFAVVYAPSPRGKTGANARTLR